MQTAGENYQQTGGGADGEQMSRPANFPSYRFRGKPFGPEWWEAN